MGMISFAMGWWLASSGIHVFQNIGITSIAPWQDTILSAIFISAGTEGFNSLMKFAAYKKEASKADAADKQATANNQKLLLVSRQA